MAKINRFNGNVVAFASGAPGTERTLFGETTQSNELTAQFTAKFIRGWGMVGPSDSPALEDFNGAMFTHGQMIAYLHQMGVAEYNPAQEYPLNGMCNSGGLIYSSRANANIGNNPATSPNSWRLVSGASSVASASLNVRANMAAAGTSLTYTADELVLTSALGGIKYVISGLNSSINIATVGAGGMDTGTATPGGSVGIYAIYNPATGATALLAVNSPTSKPAEVYSGANMPAGYTASAYIGLWRINGSSQFFIGTQIDRRVYVAELAFINTTANPSTPSASSSTAIPYGAKTVSGNLSIQATTPANLQFTVAGTAGNSGKVANTGQVSTAHITQQVPFANVPLPVPQTVYYTMNASAGVSTAIATMTNYEF